MDIFTLDIKGVGLAVLLALFMLYFGGWQYGSIFVIIMIFFLVLSWIVTRLGKQYKKNARLYQETRGVKNVLANGLGPLIFALLFYIGYVLFDTYSFVIFIGFIASAASVAADKFSSEIGVLNGAPVSIITFRKIRKGMSGGITWLGLFAGFVGAFLISLLGVSLLLYRGAFNVWICPSNGCWIILHYFLITLAVATIGGFVGTIVDSYFGHFEEKGIGNKYTSNFACSIAGGAVAALLVALL